MPLRERPDRFAKSTARKDRDGRFWQAPLQAASSKHASILGSLPLGQGIESTSPSARSPMSETAEPARSFESALEELEALVAKMESGDLPLKESLAAYKRGAALLAYCQAALKDAEQQVQVLEKGVLQPFAPDNADDNP